MDGSPRRSHARDGEKKLLVGEEEYLHRGSGSLFIYLHALCIECCSVVELVFKTLCINSVQCKSRVE